MGIEIERKFTVKELPDNLEKLPFHLIEQAYLNVSPAIRVRQEDDHFYMTYKGARSQVQGEIGQVEYNMPLDRTSYEHMRAKADGNILRKKRYLVPVNPGAYDEDYLVGRPELAELIKSGKMAIELDVFDEPFKGVMIAELEFPDEEAASCYHMADWFLEDVTGKPEYSNAYMSSQKL